MNENSKVWATARTGMKFHAFEDGSALCRKNIRPWQHYAQKGASFKTLHDVLSGFPNRVTCKPCEAKFQVRLETYTAALERAHAEALETNATPCAPGACDYGTCSSDPYCGGCCGCVGACLNHEVQPTAPEPSCTCPPSYTANDYHESQCPDFQPTVTDNLEENSMTESTPPIKTTKWKGELSPLQHRILTLLTEGLEHAEIADRLELTRSYVSENVSAAAGKMGMRTTAAAVARYSSYLTYTKAADVLLRNGLMEDPIDTAEEHCNHVIGDLANILRVRAEKLLLP